MKYCIDYLPDSKRLNEVDEINVPFNKNDLITLINFLQEHKEQRSNICIIDIEECLQYKIIEKLVKIKEEYPEINFALKLDNYDARLNIELLRKKEIKFYFNQYISKWETIFELIDLGVSDIYITEDLAFELDKISNITHLDKVNVQIRCFPNVSQKSWNRISALKTFFIRPEDVEYYEEYVDVLEIFGDRKNHDLMYDIYSKDKQWYGKINEIIIGLDSDLDNRFTIPRFGERRPKCQRNCLKGGLCHLCERVEELSKTLEKADLTVRLNKE